MMDETREKISSEDIATYANHGEAGTGRMFARLHRNQFLAEKVVSRGSSKNSWYRFNGQYWVPDKLDDVLKHMQALQDVYADEIQRIQKTSERGDKNAEKRIGELETASGRLDRHAFCTSALLFAAEGSDSLAFDGDQFDQQTNKIPCENGILDPAKCDIEDGKIVLDSKKAWRDMRPEDHVRYVCTAFNPEAICPAWIKFMDEILDGDTPEGREVIDFIQEVAGYTLLGDPRQDVMVVKDSPDGRSGKGMFDKIFLRVAGSFGYTAKSGLFLKKYGNDPSKPQPELMKLKNKRVVIMSEQDKGSTYDAAEVKTKTSGRDAVSARGLYGEETNFLPTYVFWQSSNHLPRVSADDGAFWARLIRIKFPHHYADEIDPNKPTVRVKDPGLEEKLVAELPGILNWFIMGAIKYIQRGYRLPKYPRLVKEAIEEYRRQEDSLNDFIEECCITGEREKAQADKIYTRYCTWCKECNRRANSTKTFKIAMNQHGFDWVRRNDARYYLGVGLLPESR